jgi:hypothetical protein
MSHARSTTVPGTGIRSECRSRTMLVPYLKGYSTFTDGDPGMRSPRDRRDPG